MEKTIIRNQDWKEIVNKFFFEQCNPYLGIGYRHGFLRSVFVLLRTLYRPDKKLHDPSNEIKSHRTIAFVFFLNEYLAATKNKKRVQIDKIIFLDLHNLKFVRKYLSGTSFVQNIIKFIIKTLKIKGIKYYNRLTYPLLSWLLYNALIRILSQVQKLNIVTTNMQHPLSLACAQAAVDTGHSSFFCEHATTPRAVVQPNNIYHRYFVNFPHTKKMLIQMGVKKSIILCKHKSLIYKTKKLRKPIKNVGICINELDSLSSIVDISCIFLEEKFRLFFRVHDSDSRHHDLEQLALKQKIGFSSARKTKINTFLKQIDLVVVGNSNVLADAIIANKKTIYYWAGDPSLFDYYGLVEYYNVPNACNTNVLVNLLKKNFF